jgi:Ca2+-transporting ATPase
VFVTLVSGNLALIFSSRSGQQSIWQSLRVPNRTLWVVTGITSALTLLALYWPWLAGLFVFDALAVKDLALATLLGIASVVWLRLLR